MIKKELEFYSLLHFYPQRESIKKEYSKLSTDEIIEYKMYVYSIPFEDEFTKDLIWEYLNGWQEGLFEMARKYRHKKDKMREHYGVQNNAKIRKLERDNKQQ